MTTNQNQNPIYCFAFFQNDRFGKAFGAKFKLELPAICYPAENVLEEALRLARITNLPEGLPIVNGKEGWNIITTTNQNGDIFYYLRDHRGVSRQITWGQFSDAVLFEDFEAYDKAYDRLQNRIKSWKARQAELKNKVLATFKQTGVTWEQGLRMDDDNPEHALAKVFVENNRLLPDFRFKETAPIELINRLLNRVTRKIKALEKGHKALIPMIEERYPPADTK